MNKCVVFDWHGVLVPNDDYHEKSVYAAHEEVLLRFGISPAAFMNFWNDPIQVSRRMTMSGIDEIKLLTNVLPDINISVFLQELRKSLLEIEPLPLLQEYIRTLKGEVALVLLSDISPIDSTALFNTVDFSLFDYVQLSSIVGVSKHSQDAFSMVEQVTGIAGSNILFMDDRAGNLVRAQKLGWRTSHKSNPTLQQVKFAIEKFLSEE